MLPSAPEAAAKPQVGESTAVANGSIAGALATDAEGDPIFTPSWRPRKG
jgi:hypothetical protein